MVDPRGAEREKVRENRKILVGWYRFPTSIRKGSLCTKAEQGDVLSNTPSAEDTDVLRGEHMH